MPSPLTHQLRQGFLELRKDWRTLAVTFAIAGVGGMIFAYFHLPLPWVLGAMTTSTIAAMAGVRMWVPRWIQVPMTFVLGLLFGTTIAPNIFARLIEWLPSIITIFVFVIVTTAVSMVYLIKVMKTDPVTAYFSSSPGGVIPMSIMGAHYGGELRVIGLVQSMRLIATVVVVPIAFSLFAGYHPTGMAGTGVAMSALHPPDIPILIAMAVGGWLLAKVARLPAPELVGPLLVMSVCHASGVFTAPIPDGIVAFAQVAVGARLGGGFYRLNFRTFGAQLLHATTVAMIMLAMGALFALAILPLSKLPFTALMLAYAPGGIAEMSIVAFNLGIEVVFVITHQLIRFVFVIALVPIAVRVFKMKPKIETT
jgi:membrane AbrB-like protein